MNEKHHFSRITALAGGVGGAKLAAGLNALLGERLTVIINTGDDFEHLGLKISPDIDTVCYTLAGLSNPETGWGRSNETWNALRTISSLGGLDWFQLGDQDIGLHLERSYRLSQGQTLSKITQDFCQAFAIKSSLLPMSDQKVSTWVFTENEELPFQEYFVHQQCKPIVKGFYFEGVEDAKPAPGVLEDIADAEMIVICPSNPWVSIGPILAIPGIVEVLIDKLVIAVSPIIGGKAIKGPAAKMYSELGFTPSALAVARHYREFLSGFILDQIDQKMEKEVQKLGMHIYITDTIMKTDQDRVRLAKEVIEFGERLIER
jgi:LPPG:FO 2-phospho-L-lactate transferase